MAILDKFTASVLGLDGKSPQKYNQVSKLDKPKATSSQLDRNGVQPAIYNRVSKLNKPKVNSSD